MRWPFLEIVASREDFKDLVTTGSEMTSLKSGNPFLSRIAFAAAIACLLPLPGVISAQVAPKPAIPSASPSVAGRATLHVYRQWHFAGSLGKFPAFVDEREVASVGNGRFFVARLEPGRHVIRNKDKTRTAEIDMKAGQDYYVRLEFTSGFVNHMIATHVAEEVGRSEMQPLKPVEAGNIKDPNIVVAQAAGPGKAADGEHAATLSPEEESALAAATRSAESAEQAADLQGALNQYSSIYNTYGPGLAPAALRDLQAHIVKILSALESSASEAEGKANQREALAIYMTALNGTPDFAADQFDQRLRVHIFTLVAHLTPPPAIPEEARRHVGYAAAAVQLAEKDPAQLDSAIDEFQQALRIAPWWPELYYNTGLLLEKKERFGDAARCLNLYLLAAPNAQDAAAVRQRMYALEYKEKALHKN